ncbi:MAG: GWxTD domain-containing protein [Flavobacteriales bacterium]|nr:GWxTD domain-containing protein [Flavobacteriales bacterium]
MMRIGSIIGTFGAAFVLTALLHACGSSSSAVQRDNLAYLYGKGPTNLRLEARVYHEDAEHTVVFFKLHTEDLLYKSDGGGAPYKAQVRIAYGTFAEKDPRNLLDSASTMVNDVATQQGVNEELIGRMELQRDPSRAFLLKVVARDMNRDNESEVTLRLEADPAAGSQYFMPIDPANGLPLFSDQVHPGRPVAMRTDRWKGRTLRAERFPVDASLPPPVFSGDRLERKDPAPDSSFTVEVDTTGRFTVPTDHIGLFRFTPVDADSTNGCSVTILDQSFPYVDRAADMVKPLRYITSTQEYDRIAKSDNVRKAVERFWLDATGDRERAREAIRIFYGRVENANRHFNAAMEGWRTDRGLVHIIFGTPTTIYRNANGETWTYGEENNIMSLTFNFVRRRSDLTDNDLILQRDPVLKGAWYRNVESWRNGRVYQN